MKKEKKKLTRILDMVFGGYAFNDSSDGWEISVRAENPLSKEAVQKIQKVIYLLTH